MIVRFGGELFFANATYLRDAVRGLAVGVDPPVHRVILDASAIPRLDTTAADVVSDLVDELDAAGVELVLARASHRLRTDLYRFGLAEGRVTFVASVGGAVAAFLSRGEPDARNSP